MTHFQTNEVAKSPKWYNKPWWVALLILGFWPAGLYGLFKSDYKKGILLRCFGILVVGLSLIYIAGDKFSIGGPIDDYAVKNSQWDNSVDVAERYLKHNMLKDPSSYESISWTNVSKNKNGTYGVSNTFRARNSFGGMGIETVYFTISSDGKTVLSAGE